MSGSSFPPRRRGLALLTALAALAAAAAAPVQVSAQVPDGAEALYGTWRNPKNSVHVDIRPCGAGVCGYVVWASDKAKADARAGGTDQLLGLQLFRDFTPRENGVWRGKVFVPDLGRTFTGAAEPAGPNKLKARGCLFANVLCKSQTWTRVRPA